MSLKSAWRKAKALASIAAPAVKGAAKGAVLSTLEVAADAAFAHVVGGLLDKAEKILEARARRASAVRAREADPADDRKR